jgi:SAM-dependent methyltransferase
MGGICAACGGNELEAHLGVAGEAGPDGLIPTTDRFGTALADIVRCPRCGHMQLERFPAEEDLSEAYEEAASRDYVEEEAGQRATARAILERIEAHVAPGGLLDLGSWVGFFLAEGQERGWTGVGVEPSEFAARFARDQLGLDVRQAGLFDAELGDERFDAVFLGDVIEHLPRAGEALDRIGALLAPQGVLAMALPDAGSRVARLMGRRWWSVLPTHVHYFTRASIRTLLERQGYEVLEITSQPKTFSVAYYLGRLGGYSDRLGNGVVAAARAVGVADRPWTPDFRDRMLVLARRAAQPAPPDAGAA